MKRKCWAITFFFSEQKSSFFLLPISLIYCENMKRQPSQCLPNVNVGSFTCLANIPSRYWQTFVFFYILTNYFKQADWFLSHTDTLADWRIMFCVLPANFDILALIVFRLSRFIFCLVPFHIFSFVSGLKVFVFYLQTLTSVCFWVSFVFCVLYFVFGILSLYFLLSWQDGKSSVFYLQTLTSVCFWLSFLLYFLLSFIFVFCLSH